MRYTLRRALAGLYYFVYYVGCILLIGSAGFASLFLVLGLALSDYTAKELLYKGLSVGFRYAGVWAGGTALVLAIKKIAEKKTKGASASIRELEQV